MAIIANRIKNRGQLQELGKLMSFAVKKASIVFLLILSLLLISGSANIISRIALEVSGRTVEATSLIYQTVLDKAVFIYNRIGYFKDLEAENTRLRMELSKLHDVHDKTAIANAENTSLKKLLKVAEIVDNHILTTKLLSISTSPFTSSAIIGAGENQGIKINDIITSNVGLIGRVIQTSSNYSTIMLIDDQDSRIPIITGKTQSRGILAKQNGILKIIYIDNKKIPMEDEIVYTSGDGKIYPDGLKVGKITNINNDGIIVGVVAPYKEIDFVVVHRTSSNSEVINR